jgi:CheY-like chemotaxis protein
MTMDRIPAAERRDRETTSRRVLVVDDDAIVRRIVGTTLERSGYVPVYAVDGDAGWRELQQQVFDLVITDRSMPNADGLELIRRIRASVDYASLPVIMLSGSLEGDKGHDAKAEGANAFLNKSMTSTELLETIERVLIGSKRPA